MLLNLITDHPTGASPLAKDRGSSTYELSSYFRVFKSGFSSKLRFDKNDGGVGFSKMGALAIMTEERCASVFDKNDGGVLLYDKNEDFCSFIILAFLLFHYLWGLRLEGTTACIALDDSSSHYALPLVLLDLITDHPTGASLLAKGRGSSTDV